MATNTKPIWPGAGIINNGEAGAANLKVVVTGANTSADLTTTTNAVLVFTADATNGGIINKLRFKAYNTDGTTATAATCARIYICDGTLAAANCTFLGDITLPATTMSYTTATPDYDYQIDQPIPAGYKIYVAIGIATGGSTGWAITAFGGDLTLV
jgi:hypothetical protein